MVTKNDKKFLEVDAKEVRRCISENIRETLPNGFENVGYHTGYATIDRTFSQNGVPEEFQKVFFNVSGYLPKTNLFKKRILEFFSETFFELTTMKNECDGERLYCGKTELSEPIEVSFFTKDPNIIGNSEMLKFIDELQGQGLLDNYLRSVLLFFANEFSRDYIDLGIDDLKLSLELPQK